MHLKSYRTNTPERGVFGGKWRHAWACLELDDMRMAEALLDRAGPQAEAQHHNLALLDVLRVRGLLYTRMERFTEASLICARLGERPYAGRIEQETAALEG
jgi:hypothetical protein